MFRSGDILRWIFFVWKSLKPKDNRRGKVKNQRNRFVIFPDTISAEMGYIWCLAPLTNSACVIQFLYKTQHEQ